MHYKKLIIASCVLMSVGMLYGGSANSFVSAASTSNRFIETSLVKTNAVTPKVHTIQKVSAKKVSAKVSTDSIAMVKLPKGISRVKAETKANPQLEALIIDQYKIPDDQINKTTYYYNYVDLNNDGKKEIFVVINGPYTSGSGGSSALWVTQNGGKLSVKQKFTLMNVPIIISNHKTNGVNDLIVPFNGGGAKSQYKVLTSGKTSYTAINNAKSIKSLDGIKGKAIITNDILKEIENGKSGIKLNKANKTKEEAGLPSGITKTKSEIKAIPGLETLIVDQYGIPKEDINKTSYYYNYVDLNGNGHKQIFVVISGPYTSGSGGNSAMLVTQSNGKFYVDQKFTLVNVPVIISNHKTNGVHDIIVPFNGGGAKSQYKVLTGGETSYTAINDAKSINSLDGIKGKAIITNDIMKELEKGQSGIKLTASSITTNDGTVSLPAGIEKVKAETKAFPKLESLIIDQYGIADEAINKTSYYYNYVDLNDDGQKEIFVVISGPYTSGSGGDSAMLVAERDGKLYVSQKFTLVNVPVIISDHKTNGLHDLIIPFNGGGAESQYKVLTGGETAYTAINDAKGIKSLDGIKGKAIITNDILKELQNGQSGLKLQKQ